MRRVNEYDYSYSDSKGKRHKSRLVCTKNPDKSAKEAKKDLKQRHPEFKNLRLSKAKKIELW